MGVANFALIISEALVAVIAVLTLAILLLRGALSIERRVANLETKVEPFWEFVRQSVPVVLQGIKPAGNPISAERWQELLVKLQKDSLSSNEARELNAAFLEQQEEAKKKNDVALLIALGLGMALLTSMLKQK